MPRRWRRSPLVRRSFNEGSKWQVGRVGQVGGWAGGGGVGRGAATKPTQAYLTRQAHPTYAGAES